MVSDRADSNRHEIRYDAQQVGQMIHEVSVAAAQLTPWEQGFIKTIAKRWAEKRFLSDKEYLKLVEIHRGGA